MGKDTNFSRQPVLSQLIKLMDKSKINTFAAKNRVNRYVKHLDGYTHLVVMLYAVLCNLRSLRDVCLGFGTNATRMNHLGLDYMIRRSTLSDANKRRPSSFFGGIYRQLYEKYAPLLSDSRTKREISTKLYVMDSTTITLFSDILKGAGRNSKNGKKKGGIKAHTIIQEDIDLPVFVDYTAAARSDRKLMDRMFSLLKGSFIAFDMGYFDYLVWKRLDEAEYKFVTRLKDNAKFQITEWRKCPEKDIIADQIVEFSYNKRIERPMTAEQVCETYRRRWTIESLFNKLKSNFPLKYFLGDNVNAIEIQIWVTMIAYLLLRVIQHKSNSKLAFSNIVTVTRITISSYVNIILLLNNPRAAWEEL